MSLTDFHTESGLDVCPTCGHDHTAPVSSTMRDDARRFEAWHANRNCLAYHGIDQTKLFTLQQWREAIDRLRVPVPETAHHKTGFPAYADRIDELLAEIAEKEAFIKDARDAFGTGPDVLIARSTVATLSASTEPVAKPAGTLRFVGWFEAEQTASGMDPETIMRSHQYSTRFHFGEYKGLKNNPRWKLYAVKDES